MNTPTSLKKWFFIHFIIDFVVAIPLFFFTEQTISLLSLPTSDVVSLRIIAAALFAIGGVSFLVQKSSAEVYSAMLKMKLIWSSIASVALLFGYINTKNISVLIVLIIFVIFFFIWFYFLKRIS